MRPSALWSPLCCLFGLAVFLCSLQPAQPAPSPHCHPCQSSIPQAWLHLPSRNCRKASQQPSSYTAEGHSGPWASGPRPWSWLLPALGLSHERLWSMQLWFAFSHLSWAALCSQGQPPGQYGPTGSKSWVQENRNPELPWDPGGGPAQLEILDSPSAQSSPGQRVGKATQQGYAGFSPSV